MLSIDEDEEMRTRVAEILHYDSPEAEKILIFLTSDKSEMIRTDACDSLCNSKSQEVFELLKNKLKKDKSALVRGYAALSTADIANNICYDKEKLTEFIQFALKRKDCMGKNSFI
ncbi:hypothetical protein OXPF_11930 [Oxobacter pfennigii]|uniref:HEAT repeat protein n=1 Tax=Oxobacter pfennigii TaxID=36849 RepID=A0A0P8YDH2_9CLOT|nr:HEAT repeat domain-containing protein [Oxobacter pfennigii]KPU45300.1 hypothetical protein OXPF_11930 [Oxobacter pfennigii]